jgi:hypothetical protein
MNPGNREFLTLNHRLRVRMLTGWVHARLDGPAFDQPDTLA